MVADDISTLVEFADSLVYEQTEQHLETVEKDILRQTLKGKKLSAIEFPSYENSYVQRYRAPQLWKLLSVVAGEKVGKKTVLEVLQRLQSQRSVPTEDATLQEGIPPTRSPLALRFAQSQSEAQNQSTANAKAELNGHAALNGSVRPCLLINGQLPEFSQAEHPESEKVEDDSPDFTAQECQSQTQSSQPDTPDETSSSTDGLSSFMNFMKPGMPLLLSLGVLGCLLMLSWLANWYGVTNHLARQLPKAQLGYSLALKLTPWSAAAHYNQGAAYEDQHNYDRAHAEYQLAIAGGLIEAYNNQARLYILEGNYEAAISLLRSGLPLAKDDRVKADMYKNQGWARLEQSRYAEAKLDLTEAIKLKSESAPAYCLLAQAMEREEDKKAALEQWENCLGFAYQPNTPEEDKWLHLARQRLNAEGGEE